VIRIKVVFNPKKHCPISINYKYYLANICNELIKESNMENKKKNINNTERVTYERTSLISFSKFYCTQYEIKNSKISFQGSINWYIYSPSYELVLFLVHKLFKTEVLKIGSEILELCSLEVSMEESSEFNSNNKKRISFIRSNTEIANIIRDYRSIDAGEKII
jgi:CRISPR/Cas system endoribonuclease Cas6 (RAMP superfamily)